MNTAVRMIQRWLVAVLLVALLTGPLVAADDGAIPSGAELSRHVDFVNRFAAVANVSDGNKRKPMVVVDRAPRSWVLVNTLQRWQRNDYPEGRLGARDLAIFASGNLKGVGILATDHADPADGRAYLMWLPSLRKIRRFSEPEPRQWRLVGLFMVRSGKESG